MIFGKTISEKNEAIQRDLKNRAHGFRRFVLFDKLADDRWVFFQHVWTYEDMIFESDKLNYRCHIGKGIYAPDMRRNYTEKNNLHMKISYTKADETFEKLTMNHLLASIRSKNS
jgi:hypothetical protein